MSKIDKEKLIQLKREGKTDAECAKVFDCSQAAVSEMRRRLERDGRLTPATVTNAEDYIAEKQLQRSSCRVRRRRPLSPANAGALPEGEPKIGKTVAEYLAEEEEAEAVRLAEDKDVLTNDDEICYEPVESPKLSTPDPEAKANAAAYPIPPIDRKTFWDMRRDELRGAICEYACYGLRVDPEWVEEYNELVERCGG